MVATRQWIPSLILSILRCIVWTCGPALCLISEMGLDILSMLGQFMGMQQFLFWCESRKPGAACGHVVAGRSLRLVVFDLFPTLPGLPMAFGAFQPRLRVSAVILTRHVVVSLGHLHELSKTSVLAHRAISTIFRVLPSTTYFAPNKWTYRSDLTTMIPCFQGLFLEFKIQRVCFVA